MLIHCFKPGGYLYNTLPRFHSHVIKQLINKRTYFYRLSLRSNSPIKAAFRLALVGNCGFACCCAYCCAGTWLGVETGCPSGNDNGALISRGIKCSRDLIKTLFLHHLTKSKPLHILLNHQLLLWVPPLGRVSRRLSFDEHYEGYNITHTLTSVGRK